METLVQPNSWSCFPTALAMVARVPLEDVLRIIGHDGSDILYPQYTTDPYPRRAFNSQDIMYAGLKLGIALVPFDDFYYEPTGKDEGGIQHSCKEITDKLCLTHDAVIIGEMRGSNHAVAWNSGRQLIHDPSTGTRYPSSLFKPDAFYFAFPISQADREKVCKEE